MRKMIKRGIDGTDIGEVDESSTLDDIRSGCPLFFETPHGDDEEFEPYRGCLVQQGTANFSSGRKRMTSVYLYFPKGYADNPGRPTTYCVSSGSNINSIMNGEMLIDKIIDSGVYFYGI